MCGSAAASTSPGTGTSITRLKSEGAEMELKSKPSGLSREDFLKVYGAVYEHSPWIAEAAYAQKNIDTVDGLHTAMKNAVDNADTYKKLALIKAHPDLACAPAERETLS